MINAAVFGAGRIGKVHTHNIAGLPGVALRYVVDVNPVAASELAGIYGAKPATIEAALGDPEVHAVVPEPLFFDRYRVAFAAEMEYFFDAVGSGKPARTDIHDGVKALELAEAATRSWREQRIVELEPSSEQ